jgi:hypothetical protein
MTQAVLGFASEARRLRRARAHLRRLFPHLSPYLPKEPGCNKRLRKEGRRAAAPGHGATRARP